MNPIHAHASHFAALSAQYTFHTAYPADSFIKQKNASQKWSGNAVKSSCWQRCLAGGGLLVHKAIVTLSAAGRWLSYTEAESIISLCHGWEPVFVGNWFA